MLINCYFYYMRFFAMIMSFILLSIVATPMGQLVMDHESSVKNCCVNSEATQNDHQENQDNGCCDGSCNPLINCCGMMGFLVPDPLQISVPTTAIQLENFDLFLGKTEAYNVKYWQPPRV
jgi:hypothetical protein